ncbi:MAG: hypothetical protein Q7V20_03735 [Aquabacterium sp.]|uniref:hypothetical protein n=1 Tax=Aquabacterium sp. TaxID=1872578 RepID=UPI00271B2288|nr:hypothetical protein [Aquabacterium sp.]MDO9002553.1 hypothetical protein [Aquabacterium sp.]
MKSLTRRLAAIAWPAFLGAGVLEIAVFAFVDPASLQTPGGSALEMSATAVYSIAFFVFWAATAAACALTLLLQRAADDVNSRVWRDG